MRKITTLALLTAVALGGCTSGSGMAGGEDCDAEDFANREADCGFVQASKSKPKKPGFKIKSKKR